MDGCWCEEHHCREDVPPRTRGGISSQLAFLTSLRSHRNQCEHLEDLVSFDMWLTGWLINERRSGFSWIRKCTSAVTAWGWCAWECFSLLLWALVSDRHRKRRCACPVQVHVDGLTSRCGAVKRREVNLPKVSKEPLKTCRLFGGCYFKIMLHLFSSVVGWR